MATELTPDSMSSISDLLRWFNDLSEGIYIPGFLFVLMTVIFYVVNGKTSDKLLVSSMVTAVIGTLFRSAQLLNDMFTITFWVLAGVAVMYAIWSRD